MGKLASADTFAEWYRKVSDITIPAARKREVILEKRQISKAQLKEIMEQNIPMEKLKKKKFRGPQDITNEMLQHLGNNPLKKLLDIFNHSWQQGHAGTCSPDMEKAIMILILRKGKTDQKSIATALLA